MTQFQHDGQSIGVRCAANHRPLWFYLPQNICEDNPARLDHIARLMMVGGTRMTGVIVPGRIFLRGLLPLIPCYIRDISVRPNNVCIEVKSADDWRELLPQIVSLIREAFGLPGLPVSLVPAFGDGVENWHQELLRELFDPPAT